MIIIREPVALTAEQLDTIERDLTERGTFIPELVLDDAYARVQRNAGPDLEQTEGRAAYYELLARQDDWPEPDVAPAAPVDALESAWWQS